MIYQQKMRVHALATSTQKHAEMQAPKVSQAPAPSIKNHASRTGPSNAEAVRNMKQEAPPGSRPAYAQRRSIHNAPRPTEVQRPTVHNGEGQAPSALNTAVAQAKALDLSLSSSDDYGRVLSVFASPEYPVHELSEGQLRVGIEILRCFGDQGPEVVVKLLPATIHPALVEDPNNLRHINLVFRNAAREEDANGTLRELAASLGTDLYGKTQTQGLPIAKFQGLSPQEAIRALDLPASLAKEDPERVAQLLQEASKGRLGDYARQYRRLISGSLTAKDAMTLTRIQTVDRILQGAPPEVEEVLRPALTRMRRGEIGPGDIFKNVNPEAARYFSARVLQTQEFLKFISPLEGTYVHNYAHPQLTYDLAKRLGLSDDEAVQAACEQVMHGFGNAFVASGYPGVPDFDAMRMVASGENGPRELPFSEEQVGHLGAVAAASLKFARDLQVPTQVVAEHPEWNFPADIPPPVGFQALGTYALTHNNGRMPAGFLEWLAETPEVKEVQRTRREAGSLARQANVDNDSNFGGASMGKWLGIIKNGVKNPGETKLADLLVGLPEKHQGLTAPANMYRAEQALVGPDGAAPFDFLFAPAAARLGLFPASGGYDSILKSVGGQYQVRQDAPAEVVRVAAQGVRDVVGCVGTDVQVLEDFYNRKMASQVADKSAYSALVQVGAWGEGLDEPLT